MKQKNTTLTGPGRERLKRAKERTDRAVYWTVPHTSGKELWLEPWPDDRSDHTGACLSRPTSLLKTYGRARIHFGRAGRGNTYLGELSELSELSDTTLELDELSEQNDTSLELNELSNTEDGAGSAAGRNEPFQPKEKFIKKLVLSFLVRLSPSFDPSFVGQFSFLSDLSSYQPYRRVILILVLSSGIRATLPVLFTMFGLQRKSNKEKHPRLSVSQTSFKSSLNYFDECVSVQEKPNRWSKEHVNTSKGESDPRRRLLQFDVQQFCDNFVKGVDKALKDVSKSQKKSTSTRAPVAEPSLFISKKAQGKSENHFEELKDFSDSLPIFDESDEELIESLMFCEKNCDLPSLETEFNLDNEQAIVELTVLQPELPSSLVLSPQVFEEEPLDFPHQCPCLDTRICLDDDLGPIFDEEDEPGPVFDEEATSITSIAMENYLCFDPGTTPAPLPPDLQEHCEEPSSLNSLPDMFVKVSTDDVIRFGLDKMKDFFVSKSVFDNMINSLKIFEPDKCLDQSRFQNVNGITSGIILSFDQFLEHNKGFHLLGRPFDLDLQQTDFCAEKSLDSLVCKGNSFDLSSSRHVLITDELFASSYALDEILIQKLLEQKSLETENDFRDLEFCGSVLQPDLLSFETDNTWHFLRSFRDNGVVLSSDDILVYNTFFEKCLELLINDSQTELKLVCSDVGKDMPILKMNTVVAYLDKILVCNIYFDEHLERLKNVQFVLGKDILICDLNKYLSCTFDPGLLVFVLSIQERQVQPLNESIGRAQQPQIWRSFVVQTGYLGASDRGSVQEGYLNSPKVFCLESNFTRKPTHQGFTEAWNRMKSFTDEEVMNFPNRRFFSPSIREYQISKGDSCPRKNRPEPKPILHEPKVFPQSFSCLNQKHCKDHELIASTLPENLTCLMLAHVLDDYPKGLDPDFDVLRIEKPFDYFFGRFDVVSLVALNKQDKHDQFISRASTNGRQSTLDLRTNPFEEGGNDRPRSTAQYMEPNQPGDQNVLNISTEVHVFHRTGQTDRAVYWTVPHTSGKELWLEPWPDDRSDHTGACLSRPTSLLKTYGRARIHFGRAGRGNTYLGELDELSELSDTTLELDELSEQNDTSLELNELSNTEDGAGSAAGRNGPFQPKEKFIKSSLWDCFFPNSTSPFLSPFQAHSHQEYQEGVSKEVLVVHGKKNSTKIINFELVLSFLVRLSPSFDPSFVGPVRHIRQRSKSGSIFGLFRNP
ncbi:hypothetical protein IGI04_018827 [Brassica rapa subsp. trilocularis]|uniref:Uncharacterized protein n=1 Tax=Brassica rapa subsp. trilocularis TaxID=1813537 RepID=A0ABQ7ME40_BRACM|nr:hypothetical protein IGI04_018827 [Brassica rapa subsp. trilocularis]